MTNQSGEDTKYSELHTWCSSEFQESVGISDPIQVMALQLSNKNYSDISQNDKKE